MKKWFLCALAAVQLVLLSTCAPAGGQQEAPLPETVEMHYFYEEACGSCDGTEELDDILAKALADVRDQFPYTLKTTNIYANNGWQSFEAACEALGSSTDALQLPLLVVGGKAYQGHEVIAANLREAYLTAGEELFVYGRVYDPLAAKTGDVLFEDYPTAKDGLTLVYFYRVTCEECAETAPLLEALPEAVELDGKTVPVELVRINTRAGNNDARIAAFFEAYSVPDEERMVPIVFYNGGYLAGYAQIEASLAAVLADTGSLGFTYP